MYLWTPYALLRTLRTLYYLSQKLIVFLQGVTTLSKNRRIFFTFRILQFILPRPNAVVYWNQEKQSSISNRHRMGHRWGTTCGRHTFSWGTGGKRTRVFHRMCSDNVKNRLFVAGDYDIYTWWKALHLLPRYSSAEVTINIICHKTTVIVAHNCITSTKYENSGTKHRKLTLSIALQDSIISISTITIQIITNKNAQDLFDTENCRDLTWDEIITNLIHWRKWSWS